MKAKVIETGEIIDVQCLYPVTYSRLDCNGKIIEEYDEDELEFPKEKATKSKIMDIKDAIESMERYLDGILEYPDKYRDPNIDALETLIKFSKSLYPLYKWSIDYENEQRKLGKI